MPAQGYNQNLYGSKQQLNDVPAYLWLCECHHQLCHHQYIAAQGRGNHQPLARPGTCLQGLPDGMETLAALPELLNKRQTLAQHGDLKQEVNSNSLKATSGKERKS